MLHPVTEILRQIAQQICPFISERERFMLNAPLDSLQFPSEQITLGQTSQCRSVCFLLSRTATERLLILIIEVL